MNQTKLLFPLIFISLEDDSSIRLDRLTLAAGHDLTGTGRLRRDDDAAIVLQRNKDQREIDFCLLQGVTPFL